MKSSENKAKLAVGDRIILKDELFHGASDGASARILEVEADHYIVLLDGDDPEAIGPVSFDGTIL